MNNTAAFSVTFTFSEDVTGFDLADISVGNGTASNLSGSGSTYTADITPSGAGDVTIDVAAAVAQDAALNDNTAATQVSVAYDSTAPVVSSVTVPTADTYAAGDTLTFTVNTSEAVTVTGSPQLALTIGTTTRVADYQSGSGTTALTFSYTVQAGDVDSDGISVDALAPSGGTLQDAARNDMTLTLNSVGSTAAVLVDAVAPTVSSVSVPANGTYVATQFLEFTVNTSEIVNVVTTGGTPQLSLTVGTVTRQANYLSGTGTTALTFRYTVPNGDLDSDGIVVGALALNGGTMKDVAGNDLTLTLSSVGSTTAVLVDAAAPRVGAVGVPSAGSYRAGQNLDFTVNASEAVTVTGSPQIALEVGSAMRQAVYQSGSGTMALTFRYTIQAGDMDGDGVTLGSSIDLNSGTMTDTAGNNINTTLNGVGSTTAVLVDTAPPGIVSVQVPTAGTYAAGDTLTFRMNAAEVITVTGSPQLALTIGTTARVAEYQSGSGTTFLTFSYTVQAGDVDSDGISVDALTLNGGTLRDAAGNDMTLVLGNVGPTGSILIDTIAPTVTISSPTSVATAAFTVNFAFSEMVTGFDASDITVTNGTLGTLAGADANYSVVVTPVLLGTEVSLSVRAEAVHDSAGNANVASDVFRVQSGSPASEFDQHKDEIRQVLTDEAERNLRSTVSTNQRMVRDARGRLSKMKGGSACDAGAACIGATVSRNDVPFDISGVANVDGLTMSTMGTFYGQSGSPDGQSRRLVFGDFDIQHDGETGSTTATMTGRVAWERLASEHTLLGYFIGGELAYSNISGPFNGDQRRIGLTFGGYAVHEIRENLYADGFLTFGAGRNNLEMGNEVLALQSNYISRSLTLGAALSGVIDRGRYQILPELAFSYARTWIGDVGFTGHAYGLVDNMLSLDAGTVTLTDITFRPEFRFALDGAMVADSRSVFSLVPRLICQQVRTDVATEACGGGLELGLSGQSEDGLATFNARFIADRIGNRTNRSVQLGFERRF